tara:strand:- start:82 stop:699 length:618 start_codon:yes stop_codon:yes gene_type:complete
MEFIKLSEDLTRAQSATKETLSIGGVVVLPTDTVYGVFSLPNSKTALEKIFSVKMRPRSMPLPLLISDVGQLPLVSSFQSQNLSSLVQLFWPGSLTVVLPNPSSVMSLVSSDEGTIAVRCPDNDFVRGIAKDLGPLAATSANLHGEPTPENAIEIADMLPGVDLVVDGGPLNGLASTLVDLSQPDPVILREGPITSEMVFKSLEQ